MIRIAASVRLAGGRNCGWTEELSEPQLGSKRVRGATPNPLPGVDLPFPPRVGVELSLRLGLHLGGDVQLQGDDAGWGELRELELAQWGPAPPFHPVRGRRLRLENPQLWEKREILSKTADWFAPETRRFRN